jgi:hypothetical protein
MSLKAFHLFFVTISILFSIGFGAWAIREYTRVSGTENLIMAIGAFVGAVILLVYGEWFLRKMEGIS